MSVDHLSESLHWSASSPATILVEDSLQLCGHFLVQQLMRMCLQEQGGKVVLVASERSKEKYKYLMKKLGVQQQSGANLVVVEAGRKMYSCQIGSSSSTVLKELYHEIEAAVRDVTSAVDNSSEGAVSSCTSNTCHVAIVFDCLSSFPALGFPKKDWMTFLHYCMGLGSISKIPFSCVMLAHTDVPDDISWIQYLESVVDVTIHVAPLEGRLADIDGQVSMVRRNLPRASSVLSGGGPGSLGGPMVAVDFSPQCSLYFRSPNGDSLRWISTVTGRDLLWT